MYTYIRKTSPFRLCEKMDRLGATRAQNNFYTSFFAIGDNLWEEQILFIQILMSHINRFL